jgi:two-component system, chemotaxis family, chemotaxis protein CheY
MQATDKRILIVDDSSTMRRVLIRSLAQAGFTNTKVIEAGDGAEALEKLAAGGIDLVLCDLNMPTMDGITFLKSIKAMNALKQLPVVVISSEQWGQVVQQAEALGVSGFVFKPFTLERFQEVVGRFLKHGEGV